MGVLIDIVDGAEVEVTALDVKFVRNAYVNTLQGSTKSGKLYDAVTTVGVPEIGEAHPDVGSSICVRKVGRPQIDTDDQTWNAAIVECFYELPRFSAPPPGGDGPDFKKVSVRSVPVRRSQLPDPNNPGQLIDVTVDPPPGFTGPAEIKDVVTGELEGIIQFVRAETSVPTARGRIYVNKVNAVDLPSPGNPLYPAGTLLCTRCESDTNDQGVTSAVNYDFAYSPSGHLVEAKWERPGIAVNAYDANSRKRLAAYEAIDFSPLGLNFDD